MNDFGMLRYLKGNQTSSKHVSIIIFGLTSRYNTFQVNSQSLLPISEKQYLTEKRLSLNIANNMATTRNLSDSRLVINFIPTSPSFDFGFQSQIKRSCDDKYYLYVD